MSSASTPLHVAGLRPRHRRVHGFSLIEVLVALVVLSVGLLGLAALQAEGLRGSGSAQMRFQAVRLMGDIVDRMRANSASLADYAVATTGNGDGSHNCAQAGATPAANCTAQQMAQYDLFLWKRKLTDQLPNGNASIVVNPADPTRFTITMTWTERADNMTLASEVQF